MDDDDKPRPVSGEIMSGPPALARAMRADGDVTDAQYETLPARAGAAPARFDANPAAAGMDFLKTGAPTAPRSGPRRGGVAFWGAGLVLVALAFWVSGGHALVSRGAPSQAAGAKPPLSIADVRSRVETRDGRAVLYVDGRAANAGGGTLALPPIEIAVTANDGGVARYLLAAADTQLKPGDRYSFSSRLEAPASGVRTVSVAFLEDER